MIELEAGPSVEHLRRLKAAAASMNRLLLFALLGFVGIVSCPRARADFAVEMMEATFRIESSATCFFLRREAPDDALYLVTAGHTIGDDMQEKFGVILRRRAGDGSYERVEFSVPLRKHDKPLWVRHEKHDIAVVRVVDPLPVQPPALPAAALADEARLKGAGARLCGPVFILTYPAGLEANKAGLPVARHGIFASPPLLPLAAHPTFLVDYNAFPGDSGAPVFIEGTDHHPLVAGIVFDQHYYDAEMKSVFQEHSIRTPLGAARIIRAEYAREVLESAAKLGEQKAK